NAWPQLFPQHGAGRKHLRPIALEHWQHSIVTQHPGEFVRGCIESDGCRHRRIVDGRNYPAYSFTNYSADILGLFVWACGLIGLRPRRASRVTVSVARRADVAALDRLLEVEPQEPKPGATPPPSPRATLRCVLPLVMSSPGAIAFQIGPIVIRWYGILMATAIVVGLWLGYRQAKRDDLPADDIISAGQWAILAGLAGARLYEVIFNWDYYGRYPSKIVAVWEGGLAMHGGLIVGPLVGAWLAYRWRIPILRGLDVAAPSMVLGQ